MKGFRKYLAAGVLGIAGALGGCQTANYTGNDFVRKVDMQEVGSRIPTENLEGKLKIDSNQRIVPYDIAKEFEKDYSSLPPVEFGLGIRDKKGKESYGVFDNRKSLNDAVSGLCVIQHNSGKLNHEYRVVLAHPENNITDLASNNQLTNKTGLLGVSNYTFGKSGQGFKVDVYETTGVTPEFENQKVDEIKITAGLDGLNLKKTRADGVFALRTAEEAGLSAAFLGPLGPAVVGASKAIYGGVSFIAGQNTPKSMFRENVIIPSGKRSQINITQEIIREANELGADEVVISRYGESGKKNSGLLVGYFDDSVSSSPRFSDDGKTIKITTSEDIGNHLEGLLLIAGEEAPGLILSNNLNKDHGNGGSHGGVSGNNGTGGSVGGNTGSSGITGGGGTGGSVGN